MTKTTKVTVIDDLDGTEGAKERTYSLGGTNYVIDLTDKNYAEFLEKFEPYRRVSQVSKISRKTNARVISAQDRLLIREYAQEVNYPLADRGRFPNDLINRYYAQRELVRV